VPTLDDLPWPIRTQRLLIRRERADDADASFAIRSQADVARWLTGWPRDLAEFRTRFAQEDWLDPMLAVEVDGRFVGDLMIRVEDAWSQREVEQAAANSEAEIGYTFDPAHQGRGYATEAVRAALGLCFDGLGLRRVTASAFADNLASRRVLEKVGMRLEAVNVMDSLHRELGWVDGVVYALLADEWRVGQPVDGAARLTAGPTSG
jgi:RimJ/RimL family protein N-acetyltransferase